MDGFYQVVIPGTAAAVQDQRDVHFPAYGFQTSKVKMGFPAVCPVGCPDGNGQAVYARPVRIFTCLGRIRKTWFPVLGIMSTVAHMTQFCFHAHPHRMGNFYKFSRVPDIVFIGRAAAVHHDGGEACPYGPYGLFK